MRDMGEVRVIVVHPMDPMGSKVGGIEAYILEFHRLELSLPFLEGTCPKTLFVHFDPGEFHSSLSEQLWARFPRLFFAMERCLIGYFDRVFSISRVTGALYKAKYPSVRVSLSSDFVDDGLFYSSSYKDVQEGKKVLTRSPGVSRQDRCGFYSLEDWPGSKMWNSWWPFFQEVVSLRDRSKLVVVGTGEMEGKARELVKEKGLDDKVTFMGPLPPGKVAELMRNSHALLLTSHFEAGPRVVLEAIASGLPVVSTDVGLVRSVVRGSINGVVCTRREPLLMARALLSVMEGWGPRRVWTGSAVKRYGAGRVLGEVYESCRKIIQRLG